MSHYQMTPNERRARRWARLAIISAANRGRPEILTPFSMRTIGEAVNKVRRLGLVKDKVLVAAGYNPRKVAPKVTALAAEKAAA